MISKVYHVFLCATALFASVCAGSVQALVILQYHHISDKTPASTSTKPERFDAHLRFLEEQGFRVISIETLPALLKKARAGEGKLPDKTAIITFDDGYRSIFSEAWPRLQKRGWPFTVFVNSQVHDEKNPLFMTWDELRKLAKNGATIANHSDSHPHFVRRRSGESYAGWQQRRQREINFAQKRIEKEIGRAPKLYAHTYGEYDAALLDWLKDQGYLGFGQQSGPVAASSDLQVLPRFPFGGDYGDLQDFATKVYSLPFPKLKVVVKDSRGNSLSDPQLPLGDAMPHLELISPIFKFAESVQCFASGQGKIKTQVKGGSLLTQAQRALPVGRSRYNCTYHAGGGRFYWYSQMFIRRNDDGTWYRE